MPVLVDYSQVCLSVILGQLDKTGNLRETKKSSYFYDDYVPQESLSEDLVRHLLLNSILTFRKRFAREWGDFIYCIDSKNSWRLQLFPHYKIKRTRSKKNSQLDWDMIYGFVNQFQLELKDDLDCKVVKVPGAEADDIIAVLARTFSSVGDDTLIISSDKDFVQLQSHKHITQYSPSKQDYLEPSQYVDSDDPSVFLRNLIIRGDDNDSIPNIFSNINSFKRKTRQKPCITKKIDEWLKESYSENIKEWDSETIKRYKQNQVLIDFQFIPKKIQDRILTYYDSICSDKIEVNTGLKAFKKKSKITDYFVKHGLDKLFEHIGEF